MGFKRTNSVDGAGGYAPEMDYAASLGPITIGDMVSTTGNGNNVSRLTTSSIPHGPVEDISYLLNGDLIEGQPYPGNTTGASDIKLTVSDSQNEVLEATVEGTALTDADVGLNINVHVEDYDDDTGSSKMAVDSSTKATTTTLPFKIKYIREERDRQIVGLTYNKHTNAPNTGGK